MRFVLFYHSLLSDWNHVCAHGLRGIAHELLSLGHSVRIFEPADGWSLHNLLEQAGGGVVKAFHATYPRLRSHFYDPAGVDLDEVLADADIVIAHEWNAPGFLRRLGEHRRGTHEYKLLFHDSPHRSPQCGGLQAPLEIRAHALRWYDGVLASSDALRRLHQARGWAENVWTWRDAVDTRVFRTWPGDPVRSLDLVWIGNWGNGERSGELEEFLIEPVRTLGLRARFYGAGYPPEVLHVLRASGIDYGGWIPDFAVPSAYASARFTANVPRTMTADGLPHTSVIRVLEALACGVPVVTAPWDECDRMFTPEVDLLVARDGREMQRYFDSLLHDPEFARFVGANGYQTVVSRHTCGHRAQELLDICVHLGMPGRREESAMKQRSAGRDGAESASRPARTDRPRAGGPWN